MEKLRNMWNQSIDELRNKVDWPSADELRESAILVLVSSVVFAAILGLVDFGLGSGLQLFYNL